MLLWQILITTNILLSSTLASNFASCQFHFAKYNVSFDVSPLKLTSQLNYYTVRDSVAPKWRYGFNICGNVRQNPPCKVYPQNGKCKDTNSSCANLIPIPDPVPAYQISNRTCYHLSDNDTRNSFTWDLLDPVDPSAGIQLTYSNGDYCPAAKANRKLVIGLRCADKVNVPDEEMVVEGPTCVYAFNISTIYGCPSECGLVNDKLCGGNGLCGYDWSNHRGKCFCYAGWTGTACDEVSSSITPNPNPIGSLSTCSWVKNWRNKVNVSFDLKPFDIFHRDNRLFKFHDLNFEQGRRHFDYYVNFCENVPRDSNLLPANCSDVKGPCTNSTNSCPQVNGNAYQMFEDKFCYLLSQSGERNYSLINPEDPTQGVMVQYNDGGYCDAAKKNRSLIIKLICPTSRGRFVELGRKANITESVAEPSICEYELRIETVFACPVQCQRQESNGTWSVCSGRGICMADPNAGFVRCACDHGSFGPQCHLGETRSPTPQPIVNFPVIIPTEIPVKVDDAGTRRENVVLIVVVAALVCLLIWAAVFFVVAFVRRNSMMLEIERLRGQAPVLLNDGDTSDAPGVPQQSGVVAADEML